jgi:queuine tRNA-ribosyltransferase
LQGVQRGVDLFDCILPTALAQRGVAFTSQGRVELRRGVYSSDDNPLDSACGCEACSRVPRSYLHHLFKTSEPTAWNLLAVHNLTFYIELMASIRSAVRAGRFAELHAELAPRLVAEDPAHVPGPAPRTRRAERAERGAYAVDLDAQVASVIWLQER